MKKKPVTEQEWIDAAEEVITRARDAAKSGDKATMRAARVACSDFIASTTLACPAEVVEAVAGVQVQLSQLIVAEDIGSIAARTVQINAFLHDIERLSARAKKAAELISLSSARAVVDNVTGIVADLKKIKKDLKAESPEALMEAVQGIVDRLEKLQKDFRGLAGAG